MYGLFFCKFFYIKLNAQLIQVKSENLIHKGIKKQIFYIDTFKIYPQILLLSQKFLNIKNRSKQNHLLSLLPTQFF